MAERAITAASPLRLSLHCQVIMQALIIRLHMEIVDHTVGALASKPSTSCELLSPDSEPDIDLSLAKDLVCLRAVKYDSKGFDVVAPSSSDRTFFAQCASAPRPWHTVPTTSGRPTERRTHKAGFRDTSILPEVMNTSS